LYNSDVDGFGNISVSFVRYQGLSDLSFAAVSTAPQSALPADSCPIAKSCRVEICGSWNYSSNTCTFHFLPSSLNLLVSSVQGLTNSILPVPGAQTPCHSSSPLRTLPPLLTPYYRRPRIPASAILPPSAAAPVSQSDIFSCDPCFAVFFNATGFTECTTLSPPPAFLSRLASFYVPPRR
jgi:hypothetical protein